LLDIAPNAKDHAPAEHLIQALAAESPAEADHVPCWHIWQADELVAVIVEDHKPAEHPKQALASVASLADDQVPVAQLAHCIMTLDDAANTRYLPAPHDGAEEEQVPSVRR
jgi:hypothetical protein